MGPKTANLLKLILCVLNIVNVVFGVVLIVIGSYTIAVGFDWQDYTASIIVIVSGSILIVIVILGCCGSIRDSFLLLMLFSVGVLLSALLDIGAVVVAICLKLHSDPTVREHLDKGIADYASSEKYRRLWDSLHKRHKCCGIDGYDDWQKKGLPVPVSCCYELTNPNEIAKENDLCQNAPNNRTYLHESGCFYTYHRSVEKASVFIIATGLIMCCLKIISIAIGCCIAFYVKDAE
ncbi:23 kDa integral membrane protein-like [Onthophagus taurus]|uniref:23 kDa integral membrane protein-like n=1 Tax=Onthophagus taurus TaxID=166361 RepID=UPI000C201FAA|nr:23 kDa integral membrane protein-like [Onthophagus taurus]